MKRPTTYRLNVPVKMPKTQPGWQGTYWLYQGETVIGAFRQFMSAFNWRVYLQEQGSVLTYHIVHKGQTVNISTRKVMELDILGNILPPGSV